jgi:hypothetical protein
MVHWRQAAPTHNKRIYLMFQHSQRVTHNNDERLSTENKTLRNSFTYYIAQQWSTLCTDTCT